MKILNPKSIALPFATQRSLSKCFRYIPQLDLVGLDHIKLERTISDLDFTPSRIVSGGVKDDQWVKAMYFPKNNTDPAFITFFTEAMYFPLDVILRFPPITTIYFAQIVAHEVAHHLIATRGYIFAPGEKYGSDPYEEEMANRYAFEIVTRMKKRRHYRFADRVLKFFSAVHFEDGRQNWLRQNYVSAARSWYKAWLLDLSNETAGDLYWQARSKISDPEKP